MLGSPKSTSHTDPLRLCSAPENGARPEGRLGSPELRAERAQTSSEPSYERFEPTSPIVIEIQQSLKSTIIF